MLEIQRCHAAIVECHAGAEALDAIPAMPGVERCRVAPDELMLVAHPMENGDLLRRATAHLVAARPAALILDQSDAWVLFSLRGDDRMRPLRQLSVIPFPEQLEAFVQGAVAGGPAKLMIRPDVVHLLVPFPLRHHLERRLRDVCAAATTRFGSGEIPFPGVSESRPTEA